MDAVVLDGEQVDGARTWLDQLRELFEDYPTVGLVDAMRGCLPSDVASAPALIRAIYVVPRGISSVEWLEEQFTWRHREVVKRAASRWK